MDANVAIYTRTNQAHGWKFERVANKQSGELAKDVNEGFATETLLVPVTVFPRSSEFPLFLDSYMTQSDVQF